MSDKAQTAHDTIPSVFSPSMRLPTPSAIAVRLIALAQDPYADLTQLVAMVECDPAMASKLLRLANSPFYKRRNHATTLFNALQMLGLDAAITLALSFSLHEELHTDDTADFDFKTYWQESLLTAVIARELATEAQEKRPESFFLSGLLREIGLLAMATTLEHRWYPIYHESPTRADLRTRETNQLGFDHVEAGAWLLREWRLPKYLEQSLLGSHEKLPKRKPGNKADQMGAVVSLSNDIARAWLADDNVNRFIGITSLASHRRQTVCECHRAHHGSTALG